MKIRVPLLLLPLPAAVALAHPFYNLSLRLVRQYKFIEKDLDKLEADLSATAYMNLVLLNASLYFAFTALLSLLVLTRLKLPMAPAIAVGAAAVAGAAVFFTGLTYPRWQTNRKVRAIDRDLLFAARHLRIQTTAGVPLFDSLVSASHGYGEVSKEFEKIVTRVQGGTGLASALDESGRKNPSYYYSRILWQLANAANTGTDVGPVLSEIVEFLSDEQRTQMRDYGAQLNTLAILYLMVCIIVPTISLIFMLVISSFVALPITNDVLLMVLGGMIFVQYMFIGLIDNRRPVVSI